METGTFMQCDLIDNLGSSMLLNNKLTFLGKLFVLIALHFKLHTTFLVLLQHFFLS